MTSKKLPMTETALILPIALFIGMLIVQVILTDRLTCTIGRHILGDRYALIMSLDLSDDAPAQSLANHIFAYTSPIGIVLHSPQNEHLTDKDGNPIEDYTASTDIFSSFHDCTLTFEKVIASADNTADNTVCITAYYDLTDIPYNIYFLVRIIFIISVITTFAMLIIFGIHLARITEASLREYEDSNITSKNTLIHICTETEFCSNIIREATRLKRHGGYLSVAAVRINNLDNLARIHDKNIMTMIEQSVLRSIIDNIRIFDIVGRFANDNRIYICMIDSGEDDSCNVAARFAQSIRDTKFFIDGHEEISIEINCGIAGTHIDKDDPTLSTVTFGETDCHTLTANACDALTFSESQNTPCIKRYSELP